MPMIKVKEKFQVTIPNAIRKEAELAVGDYLEVVIEGGTIVLKPKAMVDRESVEAAIEAGLRDVREGRLIGPFSNMDEFEEYQAKKRKK